MEIEVLSILFTSTEHSSDLYNLMHDLKAKNIKINNFEQYKDVF